METLPRVLVVEDNKRQAGMIADIVKETGCYDPIIAYNGVEARTILKQYFRRFNPFGKRLPASCSIGKCLK